VAGGSARTTQQARRAVSRNRNGIMWRHEAGPEEGAYARQNRAVHSTIREREEGKRYSAVGKGERVRERAAENGAAACEYARNAAVASTVRSV